MTAKIHTLTQLEKQHRQETEEEENLDTNIDSIGRSGDLSPTQIERLKGKNRRGNKITQPSQINTRSRKGSSIASAQ